MAICLPLKQTITLEDFLRFSSHYTIHGIPITIENLSSLVEKHAFTSYGIAKYDFKDGATNLILERRVSYFGLPYEKNSYEKYNEIIFDLNEIRPLLTDIGVYNSYNEKNKNDELHEEKEEVNDIIAELVKTKENLQDKLAEAQAQLNEVQARISELEKPQDSGIVQADSFFREYPICQELYKLHEQGKSRAEIVTLLTDENGGNYRGTKLQIGWLAKSDITAQTDAALKKQVARMKQSVKSEKNE